MNACPECGTTSTTHLDGCKVEAWVRRSLADAPPLSRSTVQRVVRLLRG